MRRMFYVLVLVCGFCLPLVAFSTAGAEDDVTGPVTFAVHAASLYDRGGEQSCPRAV